jgi:hypothetical protein
MERRADRSAAQKLLHPFDTGMEAIQEGFHQLHPVLVRRRLHLFALGGVEGQRLLAEGVLSRSRGPGRPLAVKAVGKTDVDGVDVLDVEKRLVASVRPRGRRRLKARLTPRARP